MKRIHTTTTIVLLLTALSLSAFRRKSGHC